LVSGFTGYLVSFIFHMLLSSQGLFYGNKSIFKDLNRKRKYILFGMASVTINTLLILGSFLLTDDVVLAKLISESVFIVSYLLFNYFVVPKTMLH
jgi:hypothetical protein